MWYLVGTKWLMHNGKYEPVYKFSHAKSKDGINWQRSSIPVISSKYKDECQVCFSVFKHNKKWNAIFSYRKPLNFRESSEGSYRLGYAYSNDLETWYREDEKVGINTSEKDGTHKWLHIHKFQKLMEKNICFTAVMNLENMVLV